MLEFVEKKIKTYVELQKKSIRNNNNLTLQGAISVLRVIKFHIEEGDPYKRVKTIKQKNGRDTVIEVDGETYVLRHKDQGR